MLLNDHQITLFYFFDTLCEPHSICQKDIKQALPPFTLTGRQDTVIWEQHTYNLGRDLIKPIHMLFHNKHNRQIQSWQLRAPLLQQLNHDRGANTLQLFFRQSAIQRLGQAGQTQANKPATVQLVLKKILYHQFQTGSGVASVSLEIKMDHYTDHQALLLETLHSLARFNQIKLPGCKQKISLGELIRQLLQARTANSSRLKRIASVLNSLFQGKATPARTLAKSYRRVYTHCYLQIRQDQQDELENYKKLLKKISLHHVNDYHTSEDGHSLEIIQEFDNILHGIAQEGAASLLLLKPDSPEFLRDYKNKTLQPAYIPIHLLCFHTEHALHQLAAHMPAWSQQQKQLEHDQHSLLLFQLHYFHPVVSRISTHNLVYDAINKIKKLDKQHHSLDQKSQIISRLISARRQYNYCKIAAFGVAAASYLTSFSIIKESMEAAQEWHSLKTSLPQLAETLHHYTGTISLTGSLLAGIIIYLLVRRHCPYTQGNHAHSATHHALEALHKRHPLQHK